MPTYEYKLVPAPEKASKIKGLKGAERFAATLEEVLNDLGGEGWRYLRADILPQEERSGLTGKQTTYRNLLVFIREIPDIVVEMPPPPVFSAPPPPPEPAPEEVEEDANLVNLFEHADEPLPQEENPETSER